MANFVLPSKLMYIDQCNDKHSFVKRNWKIVENYIHYITSNNKYTIPIFPLFAINFINIQTILHVLISQSRHHLYLEETTNAKHGFVWSSLNIYNSMLTFYNINLCIKINAAYGFEHTSECTKWIRKWEKNQHGKH